MKNTSSILIAIVAFGAAALAALSPRLSDDATTSEPSSGSTPPARTTDELQGSGAADRGMPVLGRIPAFELTEQNGEPYGTADLDQTVWIANFVFTRCASTCPIQTAQMAKLQETLRAHGRWDDVRLLSISVDPAHDTPEVLREYAETVGADPAHWKFLTGEREEIWELCKSGFKLPVAEAAADPAMPIAHSPAFILVDRRGQVRGYHDSQLAEEVELLAANAGRLLDDAKRVTDDPDILDPEWMDDRAKAQIASAKDFRAFHDFRFTDRSEASGITFHHGRTPDGGEDFKLAHYDHGNGVVVADVDGDDRLDIYFVSQVGPNGLWRNLGGGRFEDITESAGVALAEPIKISASFADIDNDGDPDLYCTSVRNGNFLFENDGKGKFEDITKESGLGYVGHSSTPVFFDYDRDGLLDVFLCNVGKYTTDELAPATDELDEDGKPKYMYYPAYLDAFSGHLKPERTEVSRLYRNAGEGRFVDVTKDMGLDVQAWSGDAAAIDVNEDGWLDLYVLNMQGHDEYLENDEGKRFVAKSRDVFPNTPWGSMGIQVFDFDNDGKQDIFVSDMHSDMQENIGPEREKEKMPKLWSESILRSGGLSIFGNAFFHNQGDGEFKEISDSIGAENYWPWGLSKGDVNADGFVDVFLTSSMNFIWRYGVNSLLLNDLGERFVDSEFVLGVEPRLAGTAQLWYALDCDGADSEHPECQKEGVSGKIELWEALGSRTSAIFDLDDDGDLDIVTSEWHAEPLVFISDLSDRKEDLSWLKVELVGTKSNRSGIGATVAVHAGESAYTKVFDGRSGYLSQSLYPLYFGLGAAEEVDRIEVSWPSGQEQVIEGPIAANTLQVVTEPE